MFEDLISFLKFLFFAYLTSKLHIILLYYVVFKLYLPFRFGCFFECVMLTTQKPNQVLGIVLLIIVNIVWVASSEITKVC